MRIVLFCLLALGLPAIAQEKVPTTGAAEIFIDVGQAQVKKSLLALPPLVYLGTQTTNPEAIRAGQNIYQVIVNDLTVANFFTFIAPDAYLEDPNKVGLKPAPYDPKGFDFTKWKTIGTEFLVRVGYQLHDGEYTLETYVYHVPSARMIMGRTYHANKDAWRRMAHTFGNDFLKALTGKTGMFLTKIVASKQEPGSPAKEIYISDWDGANPLKITNHQSISMSPTWSTAGDKIAYTYFAFHKAQRMRNSDLFMYDIASGKRFLVSYRKGINSGAAFFPGDKYIALTLSKEGTADLHRVTADGLTTVPLTNGPNRAMNVEAAVSPDGRTIAFSSDRSGRPMIYLANADGTNTRRLTFAGKYNASPQWSPDGKSLVFASQDKDHFDIFTMNTDGTNLKRLTSATKSGGRGANNESPSYSPDGRNVLFTSDRSGKYQLYLISVDGTGERRITDDTANWDKPKWSPFLE